MANRIAYNVASPWGAQVAELAATVVHAQQVAARLKAAFNAMAAGGAGPWTGMEAELGLTAGTGTTLYTQISNCAANLATIIDMNTIDMGQ